MSEKNTNNAVVWFDIPVIDLSRATAFYTAVLNRPVEQAEVSGFSFSIIDHSKGIGGCLVPNPEEITSNKGPLLYFNADGRIQDAYQKALDFGGKSIEAIHSIGPHGFRAVLLDSEGNRIAIHSDSNI